MEAPVNKRALNAQKMYVLSKTFRQMWGRNMFPQQRREADKIISYIVLGTQNLALAVNLF